MILDIEREQILKPLSRVNGVIERRQTLPILSNVYLAVTEGKLLLIGTDLEIEIGETVEDVSGRGDAITVPGRKLLDICRALPDGSRLKIGQDKGRVSVTSGRSRFMLQSLPANDFPSIKTDEWSKRVVIPQGVIKDLIDRTAFSMAQQDVRYYLNGLLVELQETMLRAVATDGHRLAKSDTELETSVGAQSQSILPRKAIQELSRLLDYTTDPATIEINASHLRLGVGSTLFTTGLIEGRFPDYAAVMAPVLSRKLLIDRQQLLDALTRTSILTNEKFRGVRVTIEPGMLRITANNPEQEQASEDLPVDYDSESIEIGFNVTYLIEALKALSTGEVELRLQNSNSGCILTSPDNDSTIYLVMPMRL